MEMRPIAHIRTDFPEKFGIPRQAGRVEALRGVIIFEPEFRVPEAIRGIEEFSHIWLIFDFSQAHRENWSPTVRPPRLGGNRRVGVFATRSPFRPNPVGLSCVRLLGTEQRQGDGTVLLVAGADLLDRTPILDIKPYIPYTDCRLTASGSFAQEHRHDGLKVEFPANLLQKLPPEKWEAVQCCLADDPRPSYQNDPQRVYAMAFAGWDIRFTVENGILTVTEVEPAG